jgi:peptidoglycan/xylan/chitin deacetylase (PgdA/CDA1 family)
MLKEAKRGALGGLRRAGVFDLCRQSNWRRNRLLILCYHGISLADEHLWDSCLYMSADSFESRLAFLARESYAVLPLGEAVELLRRGMLPERSVVLTFDDGFFDFKARAFPLLQKYGFPATVYLTTYYVEHRAPVFGLLWSYLLWKRRDCVVPGAPAIDPRRVWDLRSAETRASVLAMLNAAAKGQWRGDDGKNELTRILAEHLAIDLDAIRRQRVLELLEDYEVRQLAAAGIDIQLHTHRHRTPRDRQLFIREIDDNRERIRRYTGAEPEHFCYPSGVHRPEFLPWLQAAGVRSATTCNPGMAARDTDSLLLPRLVDSAHLSSLEFEGWLTGVSLALPRRPFVMADTHA